MEATKSKTKTIKIITKNNNSLQERSYKINFQDWLYDGKTKQFLMVSLDDIFFTKYIDCFLSEKKKLLMFYFNLLWRVNSVKNCPQNRALVGYDATLSYTTLFNKCIPLHTLDNEAKSKGYKHAQHLFDEANKEPVSKQIKFELAKNEVIPYLQELQKIGLIKWERFYKKNKQEGEQFYVQCHQNIKTTPRGHIDFLCVPYGLLFDVDKIKSSQMMSFLSFFKAKKKDTKCVGDVCKADFNDIVESLGIVDVMCKKKNVRKNDKLVKFVADNFTKSFVELLDGGLIVNQGCIVKDLADGNRNINSINTKDVMAKLAMEIDLKSTYNEKSEYLYNLLFYLTQDTVERTTCNVNPITKQIHFVYNGENKENITIAINENGHEINKILDDILRVHYNKPKDYKVFFQCKT